MHQTGISIRRALTSDLAALLPLIKALDAHHVEIMPENFKAFDGPTRPVELLENKVLSPDNALFIALNGTTIVGFVDVQKSSNPTFPMFVQKNFALLDNLFVASEFRGAGLAHTLFEKAKEWAKEQGYTNLQLKVYNKNEAAGHSPEFFT